MSLGKKLIIIFLFLCIEKIIWAKEYPDWEGYTSMSSMTDVIEFKGKVYGTCESGVICYDPLKEEYKLFYKNHGLETDNALSIASTSGELFIGFKDGGLMRFDPYEESFIPIIFPEYIDKEDVLKTLAVNDIYALNDSILFIGHSKGVDRLNLNTKVLSTYSKLSVNIKEYTPVNEIKIFKNKIWACTPNGLAWADADNQNLESEENWDSYQFPSGVNTIFNFIDEETGEDSIFVGTNGDGIFSFDSVLNDTLSASEEKFIVNSIIKYFGFCYAATNKGLYRKTLNDWIYIESYIKSLKALSQGNDDVMWIATSNDGLKCFGGLGYLEIPEINGPKISTFRKIDITQDNVIWTATSERDPGYVQKLQDGIWVCYDVEDGLPSPFTNAAIEDSHGNIWCGTWGRGVYTIYDSGTPDKDDDLITLVDPELKIILPYDDSESYVVCPDITKDRHGNIWIANWDKGVVVLEGYVPVNEYKYHNFPFDESGTVHYIRRVFCDDNGWVWLGTQTTGLIGLFADEDPYNTSDDQTKYISPVNGLLGYLVEAVYVDKNGYVWVGTDGGLNIIELLPNNIQNVENMNYLLGENVVEVLSIEIDRFNNKWIGTSNGLIKINPSNKFVQDYNTNNSGLFSNRILSLKYDKNHDILWVGTDKGLNKFYVLGTDYDKSPEQFHVYPNPFEIWGYNSKAVFNNLKPGNPVRIYTFTGDMVNELISSESDEYGTSISEWNGRNFKNEYVGSGIYFFTGVDKNGREFREKMVVIRR